MLSDKLTDFTYFFIHTLKEAEQDPNEKNKLKLLTDENFSMVILDLFLGTYVFDHCKYEAVIWLSRDSITLIQLLHILFCITQNAMRVPHQRYQVDCEIDSI